MTMTVEQGVLIGEAGQLFLYGGQHSPLMRAEMPPERLKQIARRFSANIQSRAAWSHEVGASYVHAIYPDKHTVMPGHAGLPDDFCGLATRMLREIDDELVQRAVLFPLESLRTLGEAAFLATDTHMSAAGMIACSVEIARRLGRSVSSHDLAVLGAALGDPQEHTGDLGAKLTPRRSVQTRPFQPTWELTWQSNQLPLGNDGIMDLISSKAPTAHGRALLFGDSFMRGCTKILSYFFREILFLRTRFLHREMLPLYAPDVVATANVERYLDDVAPDQTAPVFLLYPALKKVVPDPTPGFVDALATLLRGERCCSQLSRS